MYDACKPFGPLIYKADIRGEFHDFLLNGLDDAKDSSSMKSYLVGNIENQKSAAPYDHSKFIKFLHPHIENYIQEKYNSVIEIRKLCLDAVKPTWNSKKHHITYDLYTGPWVNFQQKHEFNPLHKHSGSISSIIFIDIPEEIEQERNDSDFTLRAAGCLEFVHINQHHIVKPKSGYMYLFPANLWHQVYPYKSDVERVTMSFNLFDVRIDGQPVIDITSMEGFPWPIDEIVEE